MKLNDKAFPQTLNDVSQYQWIESGLTKLEYFALHLMSASVSRGSVNGTPKEQAEYAVMLARALARELQAEE